MEHTSKTHLRFLDLLGHTQTLPVYFIITGRNRWGMERVCEAFFILRTEERHPEHRG